MLTKIMAGTKPTKTITIASGKGGVGKTMTAVNLAAELAIEGHKVCVLDFNTSNSDIHNFSSTAPKYSLSDYLTKKISAVDALIHPTNLGFDIIKGVAADVMKYHEPNSDDRKAMIEVMKELYGKYDYVLIELANGFSKSIADFCIASDMNIVVSSTDKSGFLDAYALIKSIYTHRKDAMDGSKVIVLITNSLSMEDGKDIQDRIINVANGYLDTPIPKRGFIIPEDREVKLANKKGQLFIKSSQLQATKIMKQIIQAIENGGAPVGIRGFLGRLFGQ